MIPAMEDATRLEEGLGHTPLANKDDKNGHISEKVDKTDDGNGISYEKEERSAVLDQLVEQNGEDDDQQPLVKQKSKRVATLDAFRGLTIVVSNINIQLQYLKQ